MSNIAVTVNGAQMTGREGMTTLGLAKENGIVIPTLCYLEGLPPTGSCRVCVVEVEGSRTLVASCHTPITQGMVIQTHSPKVLEARRVIVELLLASHCGSCYMCEKANICELREIATNLDVGIPRFPNVTSLVWIITTSQWAEGIFNLFFTPIIEGNGHFHLFWRRHDLSTSSIFRNADS